MDGDDAHVLHQCIDVLEAREMLIGFRVADFPMLKEDSRNKLFRELNNRAFPNIIREERAITTNELAGLLNRG
jgi:hypothetical protein